MISAKESAVIIKNKQTNKNPSTAFNKSNDSICLGKMKKSISLETMLDDAVYLCD